MKPATSSDAAHWAARRERGSLALMRLTVWAVRRLGRRPMTPVIYLIVFYFFVLGREARRSAHDYQAALAEWSGQPGLRPTLRSVFRQFMSFADALLDKLDVWRGAIGLEQITVDDPEGVHRRLTQGRGQLLVGAHLGNLEVCRALADINDIVSMNVLVHTRHAEQFNQLLAEAGASRMRLIQVSELDPAVMLQLNERLDRGEWLAIAGDRVPLHGARTTTVNFLGRPARLPQGPWLLAGLLRCPVNLLFCVKDGGRYRVSLEPFARSISWQRRERDTVVQQWAQRYADRLAAECLRVPLQWFNFYPFWRQPAAAGRRSQTAPAGSRSDPGGADAS